MTHTEVHGSWSVVTLSAPDAEGRYTWRCTCGAVQGGSMPIADAIADAEVHIDHQCRAEEILGCRPTNRCVTCMERMRRGGPTIH